MDFQGPQAQDKTTDSVCVRLVVYSSIYMQNIDTWYACKPKIDAAHTYMAAPIRITSLSSASHLLNPVAISS